MIKKSFFLFLIFISSLFSESINSLHSLYKSLDPKSLSQLLAFYELYPTSEEGKSALQQAIDLLYPKNKENTQPLSYFSLDFHFLIDMINHEKSKTPTFSNQELEFIEKAAKHLSNRKLKGYDIWDIEKISTLAPEEIDLARSLFLWETTPQDKTMIRYYEAYLDLMALQISLRLPPNASSIEKINAINSFIFFEMGFRFPPHSLYAKDIDMYSFLPSVVEKRQGVCLGVSVLYICLAQRLDLPLEAVTPPGHIFVRGYDPSSQEWINIETTMRGVNVPSEEYLTLEAPKLQTRNIKEVVGLVCINQAASCWHRDEHQQAVDFYQKALVFLPDDPLILELLGYNLLFLGKTQKAKVTLKKALSLKKGNVLIEDILQNNISAEGVKAVFQPVDNTRTSILEKQDKLQKIIKKHPHFRSGLFQLAITYLQLGRSKEGYYWLNKYLALDKNDLMANYYQCLVSLERYDFPTAWKCYLRLEKLIQAKDIPLKKLRDLKHRLKQTYHVPKDNNLENA